MCRLLSRGPVCVRRVCSIRVVGLSRTGTRPVASLLGLRETSAVSGRVVTSVVSILGWLLVNVGGIRTRWFFVGVRGCVWFRRML